ncbi:MAG: bifunctional diaminohydroxyphosphoribosylaminopyrimidine deaminase/5-amino-6-(5-phosphoribosylamino)uracil reductase RibD [Gammaproteobacteria bacterium]|nr:bifunctional diaminohydroxyphosphoribosylaminopyrimidine deaminase/5-amino-6-(5-phosphoribosylamino)uracil reductase RibD [Gammaproteobacteria bacterium]
MMSVNLDAEQFSAVEHDFMARALELAARGAYTCAPNPQVGCVLVRDGVVIGEGWHARTGEAHAEIAALRACNPDARGATAIVTLEPCAHHGRTGPCADALINAGVEQVIAATEDPDERVSGAGLRRLREAGIVVRCGLLQREARSLNSGFFKRKATGLPAVRVKVAASVDGAIALANGLSQWITDAESRQDVHRLRARSGAVLTGAGTVLADNPRLTARLGDDISVKQPVPVVLDRRLRCPVDARIFARPGLFFTGPGQHFGGPSHVEAVQVQTQPKGDHERLDLLMVLQELARREINDVLVEAGPCLSGAFMREGLFDELIIYQAPKLLGDAARGMFDLGALERLQQAIELEFLDVQRIGNGQKLVLRRKGG